MRGVAVAILDVVESWLFFLSLGKIADKPPKRMTRVENSMNASQLHERMKVNNWLSHLTACGHTAISLPVVSLPVVSLPAVSLPVVTLLSLNSACMIAVSFNHRRALWWTRQPFCDIVVSFSCVFWGLYMRIHVCESTDLACITSDACHGQWKFWLHD